MVGIVEVDRSEWNKWPIFMSYNPFLQTNRYLPKADPSVLMLRTSKSSVSNNSQLYIFLYCIVFTLKYHWLQTLPSMLVY